MDGRQEPMNPSLRRRLSRALLASIAGVALVAGALSFAAAYDEARERQDDVLRQVGRLAALQPLPAGLPLPRPHLEDHDDGARVIVQRLGQPNPGGRTVDQGGALPVPLALGDGLHTLELNHESFRVLIRSATHGERIVVAQETDLRDTMALDSALRTLLPFLILVPLLLLLVARLVRSLLLPIDALAHEVDARGEQDLRAVREDGLPAEVRPFVTAINRLLARVVQSVRAQQRFVADAAHELRSPLAALSLQAERLSQVELPLAGRERLTALRRGIDRSRQLIDQLLALARAQAQEVPETTRGVVSVQAVFRCVLEDLMPLAQARSIDIGVANEDDVRVAMPEQDLYTMLRNLVDNAIRYAPEHGRVDLDLERGDGVLEISVRDTGPGIAPDHLERVFHPFYRVPDNHEMGSGLGLSIVRSIADRWGVRVALRYADEPHQRGLEVRLRVPPASHA